MLPRQGLSLLSICCFYDRLTKAPQQCGHDMVTHRRVVDDKHRWCLLCVAGPSSGCLCRLQADCIPLFAEEVGGGVSQFDRASAHPLHHAGHYMGRLRRQSRPDGRHFREFVEDQRVQGRQRIAVRIGCPSLLPHLQMPA